MELFNSLFKETQALLDNSEPKVWPYRPGEEWKDIGNSELVLQKDAAYELGASGKGSAKRLFRSAVICSVSISILIAKFFFRRPWMA